MMKKYLLSLLLAFCLAFGLLGAFAPVAQAEEVPTEGTFEENITWRFDPETGVLSLSGTGGISKQSVDPMPWEALIPSITAVELAEGITYISGGVFSDMEALERVSLPASLSSIGSYAFSSCGNLQTIDLSKVTYIGNAAFENCANLTDLQFSPDLKEIDGAAFRGCASLEAVEIPESVERLGASVFENCTNLKTARIHCTITVLEDGFFAKCVSLTDVELPDSLQRISGAFTNCESLKNIQLPDSVRWIDRDAFANCKSLVLMLLPESVEEIDVSAFENCSSLRAIELSSKLTEIPDKAFFGCTALREVELPDGITRIGRNAFSDSGVYRVNIPEGVRTIDDFAFFSCERLMNLSIPASTEKLGWRAFSECRALRSISVAADNPVFSSDGSGALMNKAGTELICVPGGIGMEFAVPQGVQIIKRDAFFGCRELVAVDLPESLSVIDDMAFAECDQLRRITIPANVTKLGFDLLAIFKEDITEEERLLTVEFTGDMPEFTGEAFAFAILTAYYPKDNATWVDLDNLPSADAADITWVPYDPHTYGPWEIVEEPTASDYGLKKRVCTDCGMEETRPIAKLTASFTDIKESEYFYTPVLWAAAEGITTGTTSTTFAPHATCTRAQIVTFLWRAMGQPEPRTTRNPFTDVKPGEYYYEAVLWAVENGITTGVSETSFAPNDSCTRGQVVTFLWRAAGSPAPGTTSHSFTDLNTAEYYYDAVLWAVENRITNGMTPTTFKPHGTCTRGQTVTFLWRCLA